MSWSLSGLRGAERRESSPRRRSMVRLAGVCRYGWPPPVSSLPKAEYRTWNSREFLLVSAAPVLGDPNSRRDRRSGVVRADCVAWSPRRLHHLPRPPRRTAPPAVRPLARRAGHVLG